MFEAIHWPADMIPSRSPIHFTNELEVAASPETIEIETAIYRVRLDDDTVGLRYKLRSRSL